MSTFLELAHMLNAAQLMGSVRLGWVLSILFSGCQGWNKAARQSS